MNKRFGKNLKKQMIEKEVSRDELVELTSISPSSISKYCTGERKPGWTHLMKIKNALGCDIGDLV